MWKGVPIADDYHLRIDFTQEDLNMHNDQVLRYYIDYYRKNIEEDDSSNSPSGLHSTQNVVPNTEKKSSCSSIDSSSESNQ